jgi:hypothetical protein
MNRRQVLRGALASGGLVLLPEGLRAGQAAPGRKNVPPLEFATALQIVGPYLEDATPIDVAARIADVVGGFRAPPGYA